MAASSPVLAGEAGSAARVRLRCWGDFALTHCDNGADLKPRGRKARALMAYLAFHADKPVSRERLTGLLWGDRGEEQARASLRQAILELKPISTADEGALSIDRDHLVAHSRAVVTDIEEMRIAVARADYESFLEMLPDSDERLFANLDGIDEGFDSWLAIERSRQHDALMSLVADASATALAEGHTRHARTLHGRLREFDPEAGSLGEPRPPQVVNESPAAVEERRPEMRSRRWLAGLGLLLLALCAAIVAAVWISRSSRDPAPTIAVLPLKSSSAQDAPFAAGLSEEITTQLARQPGLRVAGRTSAERFGDGRSDLGEIGRKLHVGYVLEGSVRSVGNRVRVTVALAKTKDGLQLWSNTFDGTLDDVLNIQYRIGANVAQALNLKLSGRGPPTGALATSGQVYGLYLSARGLIRERNSAALDAAQQKLRLAVRLDPNFAPAWSSLAQTENPGGFAPNAREALARAIADANRALALAPDLAEAHGVLGMLYGYDNPLGRQHIARAAALDPNNAEFQFWLGNVYGTNADFARMFDAYRRAFSIDPLWSYAQEQVIRSGWQMGYRDEVLADVRRIQTDGSAHQAHLDRAILAEAQGDFSQAVWEYRQARDVASDRGRKQYAESSLLLLLARLGLFDQANEEGRRFGLNHAAVPPSHPWVRLSRGVLPTVAELEARNRNIPYSWQDAAYVGRAAKILINAGRAADVVALYDRDGVMRISHRALPPLFDRLFEDGPTVAAALLAVGRDRDANRLLGRTDGELSGALRRSGGRAPAWFLAMAARTWALQRKDDRAMNALDRALANGWAYLSDLDDSSLADFGDEPAFRGLRGNPRFERIRARINNHLAAERRDAISALARTN